MSNDLSFFKPIAMQQQMQVVTDGKNNDKRTGSDDDFDGDGKLNKYDIDMDGDNKPNRKDYDGWTPSKKPEEKPGVTKESLEERIKKVEEQIKLINSIKSTTGVLNRAMETDLHKSRSELDSLNEAKQQLYLSEAVMVNAVSIAVETIASPKKDASIKRANAQAGAIPDDAPEGVKLAAATYIGLSTTDASKKKGHLTQPEIDMLERMEFSDGVCATVDKMTGDLRLDMPTGATYNIPFSPSTSKERK